MPKSLPKIVINNNIIETKKIDVMLDKDARNHAKAAKGY